MTFTVFGVTYSLATAPAFVVYGIRRWTNRYGTTLDTAAPKAVLHYANEYATVYGVAQ